MINDNNHVQMVTNVIFVIRVLKYNTFFTKLRAVSKRSIIRTILNLNVMTSSFQKCELFGERFKGRMR